MLRLSTTFAVAAFAGAAVSHADIVPVCSPYDGRGQCQAKGPAINDFGVGTYVVEGPTGAALFVLSTNAQRQVAWAIYGTPNAHIPGRTQIDNYDRVVYLTNLGGTLKLWERSLTNPPQNLISTLLHAEGDPTSPGNSYVSFSQDYFRVTDNGSTLFEAMTTTTAGPAADGLWGAASAVSGSATGFSLPGPTSATYVSIDMDTAMMSRIGGASVFTATIAPPAPAVPLRGVVRQRANSVFPELLACTGQQISTPSGSIGTIYDVSNPYVNKQNEAVFIVSRVQSGIGGGDVVMLSPVGGPPEVLAVAGQVLPGTSDAPGFFQTAMIGDGGHIALETLVGGVGNWKTAVYISDNARTSYSLAWRQGDPVPGYALVPTHKFGPLPSVFVQTNGFGGRNIRHTINEGGMYVMAQNLQEVDASGNPTYNFPAALIAIQSGVTQTLAIEGSPIYPGGPIVYNYLGLCDQSVSNRGHIFFEADVRNPGNPSEIGSGVYLVPGFSYCPAADIVGPGGSAMRDGIVNNDDLMFVIAALSNGDLRADIAGPGGTLHPDGVVNVDDLVTVLNQLGQSCH